MPGPTMLVVGETTEFARRIEAADMAAFAALSGDEDPVHTDPEFARGTPFGRCIAHGAHVMALVSAATSLMSRRAVARGCGGTPVSAGYDRIRFVRPVYAGEELVARYRVEQVDDAAGRTRAAVEVVNGNGEVCLAGTHVMRWV